MARWPGCCFFRPGMKPALKLWGLHDDHPMRKEGVWGEPHSARYTAIPNSPKATHLNSRVATRWMENNRRQFQLRCDFVHDFPALLWQHEDAFIVSYATTILCAKINTTLQTVGVFLEIFHTRECSSWSLTKQAPLLATTIFFPPFFFPFSKGLPAPKSCRQSCPAISRNNHGNILFY